MSATFIPYQVDYSVKNTAKMLGFSKKKVQFKFGFGNPEACRQGLTGAQCRGSEHELTFVWSLATGKRNLFVDGKEVHYSDSGQNGWTQDRSWQHVFSLKEGNDRYRVHFITQPKQPEFPDIKPFDLRVNGVSYFQFSRIFELGTPRMRIRDVEPRAGGGGGRENYRSSNGRESPLSPEERKAIASAKVESLRDLRDHQIRQSRSHDSGNYSNTQQQQTPLIREENLLNFDEPAANNQGPPPQQQMVPVYANGAGGNIYGMQRQLTSSLSMGSSADSQRFQSQESVGNLYGQQPQQQPPSQSAQYGQGMYGQQPAPTENYGYGQQPSPQQGYGNNMHGQQQPTAATIYDSYGQQQPAFAQPPVSSYGQPPQGSFTTSQAADPTGNTSALAPYQPSVGGPAPSPYAMNPPPPLQQQQPYGSGGANGSMYNSTGSFPPQSLQSPSAQSYASYGSAPSFAQPPRPSLPPQHPLPPPPQYGSGPGNAYYGQQPPSPQGSFGGQALPPPQQQQYGQQSSFGF